MLHLLDNLDTKQSTKYLFLRNRCLVFHVVVSAKFRLLTIVKVEVDWYVFFG